MTEEILTTRFAPSPTGYLHLGHAYAALFAFEAARRTNGRFLLRIEDIDTGRCRPEYEDAIYEDLAWLGLTWEKPVRRQSDHFGDYGQALDKLDSQGLLYPCFCTRKEIKAEIAGADNAPHLETPDSVGPNGPEGPLYPGTCRNLSAEDRAAAIESGKAYALRLESKQATARAGVLTWCDDGHDPRTIKAEPECFGDVVLARKDTPTSYHLACTHDDHVQGVNLVTRGDDLFSATHIHRLLQALLGYETPRYRHHPLLTDETGARFAKRDQAPTLRALRADGHSADEIKRRLNVEELLDRA